MKENTLEEKVQLALDIHEIQNVMSMHEYYHTANMHDVEVDEIFAHKTPGVALEAYSGRFEGIETIRQAFVVDNDQRLGKRQLEEMRKIYPEIEDKPENEFIGYLCMHALTTPVIEVAEDGKTAKGVWLSPGHLTWAVNGKLRALWYWDRYGIDFVKEDGKWKIWHMHIYQEFVAPYEKSWVEQVLNPEKIFPEPDPDATKPNAASTTPHQPYSPFSVPRMEPRPPVPYRTFNETFSY